MNRTPTVFDQTAADFTAKVDKQIASGRYQRGNLFLAAAESSVPAQGQITDAALAGYRRCWPRGALGSLALIFRQK